MILTGTCLIMTGGFSVAHLYVDEILSNFSGRGGGSSNIMFYVFYVRKGL